MKQCQECGLNPANVHVTQIVDNESQTFHLCEECAQKRGIHIVLADNVINATQSGASCESGEDRECMVCHKKLSEFRGKGRLGCASCYTAFESEIDELLFRMYGSKEHHGKQYRHASEIVASGASLPDLKIALDRAIQNEHFERAAEIRDTINLLKGTAGR
jgi:protein arginine kinase activator